jgi:hypothetical protein
LSPFAALLCCLSGNLDSRETRKRGGGIFALQPHLFEAEKSSCGLRSGQRIRRLILQMNRNLMAPDEFKNLGLVFEGHDESPKDSKIFSVSERQNRIG